MKKYKAFEKELELKIWKKLVFYLGWVNVLGLIFWLSLVITYYRNQNEPFFNKRVIYVWGWIFIVIFLLTLVGQFLTVLRAIYK
ncbi:MAG: hypothetical protein Q7J54_05970 [Candidatus Woesearchaeota archaeon]|nr:hypothetical protein [Candidatus Woesearchaeota archaeon]